MATGHACRKTEHSMAQSEGASDFQSNLVIIELRDRLRKRQYVYVRIEEVDYF